MTCWVGPLPRGHPHCPTWALTPYLGHLPVLDALLIPLKLEDPTLSPFVFFHLILVHLMSLGLNCSERGEGRRRALLCVVHRIKSRHCRYPYFWKVKRINDYLWESFTEQLKFYFCSSEITYWLNQWFLNVFIINF